MKAHPYASHDSGQRRRYAIGKDGAYALIETWRSGWRPTPARFEYKRPRTSGGMVLQLGFIGLCGLYFVAQIVRAAVMH
ncbi:MAG: hypothetical protein M3N13_09920 [Candidatus Eremiobacteraeota bacterium]|nr:hypothetical protein [Candidatus Eremiobacteraeota bacterium]